MESAAGAEGPAEAELRPALDALLAAAATAAAAAAREGGSAAVAPGDGEPAPAPAQEPVGPRVLWGAFYRQRLDPADPAAASDGCSVACAAPERGPSCIDAAVARAEAAWGLMYPGEAFLAAPTDGAAAAAEPETEEEKDAEILRKALEAVGVTAAAAEEEKGHEEGTK